MKTICPKVSLVNLFVVAVIVVCRGRVYIVSAMCVKLAANLYIPLTLSGLFLRFWVDKPDKWQAW